MNFTWYPDKNRKRDVHEYFRAAVPFKMFTSDFRTFCTSKHLMSTNTSFHNVEWLAKKDTSTRNSGVFGLESQSEFSKNDWIYDSDITSSRKDKSFPSFSDVFRCYTDIREKPLTTIHKPKPVKPCDGSLNITSAAKLLCRQNDFLFPCHRKKTSLASTDDVVMHSLHDWSKILPGCTLITKGMQNVSQMPVKSVPSFQDNHELQRDCTLSLLDVMTLSHLPLPCVIDLTGCELMFNQYPHMNSVNELSVVYCRSSSALNSTSAVDEIHVQSRRPRLNCKRKCLRVYRNKKYRRQLIRPFAEVSADICESASDDEVFPFPSAINSSECRLNDTVPQFCSPVLGPCIEENVFWLNGCYSQSPMPSSVCDIQETLVQEACSFASSLFVSGKDLDSSDSCSVDSNESDFAGFMSPSSTYSADDVLAEVLFSGLSCLQLPLNENWILGLGGYAQSGFDPDFQVYFEGTSAQGDDTTCKHSTESEEANSRWNEAYSFPIEVVSKPAYCSKMVQFSSDVSTVPVLNQLEWAEAYQEARCGPWEQYARDRERFSRRIHEADCQIGWVLNPEHRALKFSCLQTSTVSTANSAVDLFPS